MMRVMEELWERNGDAICISFLQIILEMFCVNWERQTANGKLLQLRQRSVGNIEKRDMTEMTICVQIINCASRIKILRL